MRSNECCTDSFAAKNNTRYRLEEPENAGLRLIPVILSDTMIFMFSTRPTYIRIKHPAGLRGGG